MPSVSKAQARLFNAAEHNPEFAKKVGVSQKVASEFAAGGKDYDKLPERKKSKADRLYDGK